MSMEHSLVEWQAKENCLARVETCHSITLFSTYATQTTLGLNLNIVWKYTQFKRGETVSFYAKYSSEFDLFVHRLERMQGHLLTEGFTLEGMCLGFH
jgi:hypothetical protein